MAKALVGHMGGPDLREVQQNVRLRRRVADLEAEVGRLQDRNDALTDALSDAHRHRDERELAALSRDALLEPALH
jgi:hypothetical protein